MKANPEIADAYFLYVQCKGQTIITIDKTKGNGKDARTIKYVLPYPTGWAVLPEAGGLLDQPYRLMEFFSIFVRAERHVFADTISK
jgi:hypothetical protein